MKFWGFGVLGFFIMILISDLITVGLCFCHQTCFLRFLTSSFKLSRFCYKVVSYFTKDMEAREFLEQENLLRLPFQHQLSRNPSWRCVNLILVNVSCYPLPPSAEWYYHHNKLVIGTSNPECSCIHKFVSPPLLNLP